MNIAQKFLGKLFILVRDRPGGWGGGSYLNLLCGCAAQVEKTNFSK